MTIDEIGRKMPFKEDSTQVSLLLAEAIERAILSKRQKTLRLPIRRIAAVLVFAVTVGCTGWIYMGHLKAKQAPLDTFLDNMTEEDASWLQDYCAEEIQTCEWEWDDSDIYIYELRFFFMNVNVRSTKSHPLPSFE